MPDTYFILCDGRINGRRQTWFAERDTDRMNLKNTVDDILTMQVENVSKVYLANEDADSFVDVTEDIALEIIDMLDGEPHRQIVEFLEDTLGCAKIARLGRECEWQ